MASATSSAIDDELYSRQVFVILRRPHCLFAPDLESVAIRMLSQLFVMGHAAQARMQESDILVVGLTGVGVEIGKPAVRGSRTAAFYPTSPCQPRTSSLWA